MLRMCTTVASRAPEASTRLEIVLHATNTLFRKRRIAKEYLSILFLTDSADDRSAVIHAKGESVSGTCEWIRTDPAYEARLSEGSFLWFVEGPGRGKTMLSMFLLSELADLCRSTDRMQNIYYFCSAEDERRSSWVIILRSLSYQLLTLFSSLLDLFEQRFNTSGILRTSLDSREALWACIEDVF